jgi:uncharacterized membrane protein YdjX (TVP38/TMEM64 family)
MKAVPRHLLLRFLILVVVVATGFAILRWSPASQYLTVERVSGLLDQLRSAWWSPLALIAAYIVLCPLFVPASPMMIAGGVVFGPVWGTLYNIVGTFLGGSVTYFLGRALGRDFVRHLLGNRLKKVEQRIARRGFWSLVGIRFLPIPYPLVNYTAALAGVRPALFLTTTLLGLIPGNVVFTYFASLIPKAAGGDRSGLIVQFVSATVALVLLTLIPQIWAARRRRERLRELRVRRRTRDAAVNPSPAPPPPPVNQPAAPRP